MIAAKGIDLDMFYAAPTLGQNVLAPGVRDAYCESGARKLPVRATRPCLRALVFDVRPPLKLARGSGQASLAQRSALPFAKSDAIFGNGGS